MRILLDTQMVLWAASAPERLGGVRVAIESGAHELFVSPVSTLEMAIKVSIGKLQLSTTPAVLVSDLVRRVRGRTLQVSHEHASAVAELPLHHRDPFDRLLVAQATVEGMVLATGDGPLGAYGIELVRP